VLRDRAIQRAKDQYFRAAQAGDKAAQLRALSALAHARSIREHNQNGEKA
jgi:hypothetical protein